MISDKATRGSSYKSEYFDYPINCKDVFGKAHFHVFEISDTLPVWVASVITKRRLEIDTPSFIKETHIVISRFIFCFVIYNT